MSQVARFLLPLLSTWSLTGELLVHTSQDAIAVLPASEDRLMCVGDLDRDGAPEVALRRLVDFHSRFDAVSVRDGRVVRVLWDPGMRWVFRHAPEWDTGHDLDGDGASDFVVGMPWLEIGADGAGAILLVSGSTGAERFLALGHGSKRGLGASLSFAGDLDGDGRADLVASAVPMAPFGDDPRRGLVVALSGADGRSLWDVHGRRQRQELGRSLCVPGDLDCDGFAEVVVQGGPDPREKATVLSGASGSLLATISYDVAPLQGCRRHGW